MSRAEKLANLAAVLIPMVGFVLAVVLLWDKGVGAAEMSVLLGMYLITGVGITVGYHRLLTHKAFQAPRGVRYAPAILGSMTVQAPVLDWVADHRKHHASSDSTSWAGGAGARPTSRATWAGWLSCRSGSHGTTTTTRSPVGPSRAALVRGRRLRARHPRPGRHWAGARGRDGGR